MQNFPLESIFDLKRKKRKERKKKQKRNQFYVKNVTRFRHYEFLSISPFSTSVHCTFGCCRKDNNITHLLASFNYAHKFIRFSFWLIVRWLFHFSTTPPSSSPCSHFISSRIRWKITSSADMQLAFIQYHSNAIMLELCPLVGNYGFSYLYKLLSNKYHTPHTAIESVCSRGFAVQFTNNGLIFHFMPRKKKKKIHAYIMLEATKEIRNQYPKMSLTECFYIYIRIYSWA